MPDPLVVVDSSEIRPGRLEDVKAALAELAEFVEASEAEPLVYGVYFDEAESRMTVVQVHPSSASMELHLDVAGPRFRKVADMLVLSNVDVYGAPSDTVLQQLRRKAELLGGAPVRVHELHAGFMRERGALPR
jgi:hypothetical protein